MKILKVGYHRNGITAASFFTAIVKDGRGKDARDLLIVHFDQKEHPGCVTVLDLDLAAQHKIGGPGGPPEEHNAFRGDEFKDLLPEIEARWNAEMDKRLAKARKGKR